MSSALRFYFDFASPYGYFALRPLEALAEQHGRTIEYRPVLLWAVLKAHGIGSPFEAPVKRDYYRVDMVRSASFHGVPYIHPKTLPFSSHHAARLFYALTAELPDAARSLTHAMFDALFARGDDISTPDGLRALNFGEGCDPAAISEAMDGAVGRQRLAQAVEEAVADGVCGSPYIILDGEGFFGSDRLPQIGWRLQGSRVCE